MANNSIVTEIEVLNGVVKRLEETLKGEEVSISNLIGGLQKAQKNVNVALTEIVEQDKLSQTLDEESAEDDGDTGSEADEVSTPAKRKLKTDNDNFVTNSKNDK